MTPEDRLRRLRDEELWNEVRLPGMPAALAATRRSPWGLVVPVIAGLAIAVLVVTGVNLWRSAVYEPPAVVIPTGSPLPSPSPTVSTPGPGPSNTPPTGTPGAAPAQLFGGDCENILPDAKVAAIAKVKLSNDPALVGEVMGDYDGSLTGAGGFVTRQIGGLNCAWFAQKSGTLISMTFVPADRVAVPSSTHGCTREAGGWSGCRISLVENGVYISGAVGQTGGPEDVRIATALLALAKPTIVALPDVAGHRQQPGDWPLPADCDALASHTDLGPADHTSGGDAAPSVVYGALLNGGLGLRCDWSAGIAEYRPGGAWAESEIAALDGAHEITVPGFDHVIMVKHFDGYTYHFFRGSNWLFIDQSPKTESAIIRFATQVADGLDAL